MSNSRTKTQLEILEAARGLLEGTRASAVRLEDVAQKAGVSRQAVYLNFGSRAGLLVGLLDFIEEERGVREGAKIWRQARVDSEQKLDRFLAWWADSLPRIQGVARALLAARKIDRAAEAAWQTRMAELRDGTRFVVDALAREGALSPAWNPEEAADWLSGLVSVELYELMAERGWDADRYFDRLRRVVRGALLA